MRRRPNDDYVVYCLSSAVTGTADRGPPAKTRMRVRLKPEPTTSIWRLVADHADYLTASRSCGLVLIRISSTYLDVVLAPRDEHNMTPGPAPQAH